MLVKYFAIILFVFTSCSRSISNDEVILPKAYDPSAIADIPMPLGYKIDATKNQLAMFYANKKIRVVNVYKSYDGSVEGAVRITKVMDWFDSKLPLFGWVKANDSIVWKKNGQVLRININKKTINVRVK